MVSRPIPSCCWILLATLLVIGCGRQQPEPHQSKAVRDATASEEGDPATKVVVVDIDDQAEDRATAGDADRVTSEPVARPPAFEPVDATKETTEEATPSRKASAKMGATAPGTDHDEQVFRLMARSLLIGKVHEGAGIPAVAALPHHRVEECFALCMLIPVLRLAAERSESIQIDPSSEWAAMVADECNAHATVAATHARILIWSHEKKDDGSQLLFTFLLSNAPRQREDSKATVACDLAMHPGLDILRKLCEKMNAETKQELQLAEDHLVAHLRDLHAQYPEKMGELIERYSYLVVK